MKKPNLLWFVNKTYGWGWTPSTWQGWLILLIFLGLIILNLLRISDSSPESLVFEVMIEDIFLVFTLIVICYATGEKPEWRWGGKK